MAGPSIDQLNAGLRQFQKELGNDALASQRVEIAVITFGPVKVVQDYITADNYAAAELRADGDTPIGAAIMEALELLRLRKQQYQANGIAYYRPWLFLITDGAPTDHWAAAAKAIKDAESSRSLAFFPVGVDGADMEILRQLSGSPSYGLSRPISRSLKWR